MNNITISRKEHVRLISKSKAGWRQFFTLLKFLKKIEDDVPLTYMLEMRKWFDKYDMSNDESSDEKEISPLQEILNRPLSTEQPSVMGGRSPQSSASQSEDTPPPIPPPLEVSRPITPPPIPPPLEVSRPITPPSIPPPLEVSRPTPPIPRQIRVQFHISEAIRSARPQPTSSIVQEEVQEEVRVQVPFKLPRTKCPHCEMEFAKKSIQRHLKRCRVLKS